MFVNGKLFKPCLTNIIASYVDYEQKSFITLCPGLNCIKPFTAVIYECFQQARLFAHGKPFLYSLIFVGKARSIYNREAPERCLTQVGPVLTHKHQTRLEISARDKRFCV